MTHELPIEVERRALECARDAIALQHEPRARDVLTLALDAGLVSWRWAHVDPFELGLGRMIEDPDGVLAIEVSIANRPIAVVEAIRLGLYLGPDGAPFYCEPPEDQPAGQVFR